MGQAWNIGGGGKPIGAPYGVSLLPLGVGTPSPEAQLHVRKKNATNNAHTALLILEALTTGTPAANMGPEILAKAENSAGDSEEIGAIRFRYTDATDGSEDTEVAIDCRQGTTDTSLASDRNEAFIFSVNSNIAQKAVKQGEMWFRISGPASSIDPIKLSNTQILLGSGFGGSGGVTVTIDNAKNVVLGGGAIATTATDGFVYISTSAGAPTGTPTSKSGFVTLHYDTTGNELYVYNGAWRSVALTV